MLETLYINSRGQVTIPSKIRAALHLKDGSAVVVAKIANKVVLHPTYTPGEDILGLYKIVKTAKGKSRDPEVAIRKARKLKAQKSAR